MSRLRDSLFRAAVTFANRIVEIARTDLRAELPPGATRKQAEPEVDLDVTFSDAKDEAVKAFEARYLRALLVWSRGNVSLASRKADVDRMHLHRLLKRHGLVAATFAKAASDAAGPARPRRVGATHGGGAARPRRRARLA